MILLLEYLDLLGVFVFAVSGALSAVEREMDVFGMMVLALVTAVGGGTLRSVLIGDLPVPFLQDFRIFLLTLFALLFVIFSFSSVKNSKKYMLIFDALGLGVFLALGIKLSLDFQLSAWSSILLGTISASFGGVIRDILSARVPCVLYSEVYASACIAGGLVYFFVDWVFYSQLYSIIAASLTVFLLRLLAIRYNWHIPRLHSSDL